MAVGIFFVGLFAFSLLEGGWLSRKSHGPFGKAFAFAFATNTFAISIGFFVSFVILAVIMMLAFGGELQKLSGHDGPIWVAVIVAFLFPVVLLILAKRLGLRIFKMNSVTSPWIFSSLAAVIFLILVTLLPVGFIYSMAFGPAPPRVIPPEAIEQTP